MIYLGRTIRKLRLEQGISQKELAARADLTPSFVSLIEHDHRVPSITVIDRLARAFGFPSEVLIWDAVDLPRSLDEKDRRLCEMAKMIVRRFYANGGDDSSGKEFPNTAPRQAS